jgi:hypothetical protein
LVVAIENIIVVNFHSSGRSKTASQEDEDNEDQGKVQKDRQRGQAEKEKNNVCKFRLRFSEAILLLKDKLSHLY